MDLWPDGLYFPEGERGDYELKMKEEDKKKVREGRSW